MRSFAHSKVYASLVAILAILSACLVTTLLPTYTAYAFGAHATPRKGTVTRTATINLSTLPKITKTGPVQPRRDPVYINRSGHPGNHKADAASTPYVHAIPLQGSHQGALLRSFNGVSSRDSATANGFDLEPPDQGLCVGGGFVVEPVNLALSVYNTRGHPLLGPVSLNLVLGEPQNEFLSDPRCYFDPATQAFFLTALAIDPSGNSSHFDAGVLSLAHRFATIYRFDTTDTSASALGCPCFGDQPLLGSDAYNLYVSSNEFSLQGIQFLGAEVYAISKSELTAAASTVNFVVFPHLSDAGAPIATLQPAITTGSSDAEYLVHSFTVDASGNNTSIDNRLGIFAITNQQAVTTGGIPTLSNPTVVTSELYAQPNFASNPNGNVLNPDDDRLQQVQSIGGVLWAALDTAVIIPGDATRDGVAWFELKPQLQTPSTIRVAVADQGYVAAAGAYLLYPAIQQSTDGTVEMVVSVTSPSIDPTAAYLVRPAATSASFGQIIVAAPGNGPDTGFTCSGGASPCRWGDYSAAVLDPNSTNIWMATEYIPPTASQSINANWGTRVFEVGA